MKVEKKTECEIVQDLLFGYVDNTLNAESKRLVEKHLAECENCIERLKEMKEDIKQNENNQQKEIDYLKKIRRKSKIKSILMAISIVCILCFILYLYKVITVISFMNKAEKSLKTNNFYKETEQVLSNNRTSVRKEYYKDGKYKLISEIYSDDGVENDMTEYASVDSDERISIDTSHKKATIIKGNFAKMQNQESNLKWIPFISSRQSLYANLGTALIMSINTDTYQVGREYYVLRNQFEKSGCWEIWIDKETGLPIKEINKEGSKEFFPGTEVVKEVQDMIQEYKYEFGVVTNEDVDVPDLTDYEVEYSSNEEIEKLVNE